MLGQNSERQKADSSPQTTNGASTGNSSSFSNPQLLAKLSGVGIHTGRHSTVSVEAATVDGIHFHFEDKDAYDCPALWERLSGTTRTTALVLRGNTRRKIQIAMIEHFMAAAHIWRLDNIRASLECNLGEADTVELPILDGSALEWCASLAPKTRVPQEQAVWVVTQNYEHSDGDRKIVLEKSAEPCTEYTFEGIFGKIAQQTSFTMNWLDPAGSQLDFLKRIAPARTFGFLQEIEALRARGLALGGSLDNALVIDGENFLNKGGQRVENELASHKLLDAVGDFALAGKPIIGKVRCHGSGHALHLTTLKHAFDSACLQPGFLMADGKILVACPTK